MIYELKDFSKVKRMFEFWYGFDAVDATIRVFVTDPVAPRSALGIRGARRRICGSTE